ncbi:hypothetical protein KUTeg_015939 [Tegillarca granosa]|uniref:Calponin-homology (CH) domain-containing protein n=1 Tax=Tegillarca granosa TaxID=220873 RepID=A0ABQ9EJE1_TEGGR|nr:hypothetical protein KUTeg_015939 [Tegillarca granosa]
MNVNPSDYYFQEYGDLTEMPLSVLQLDPADRAVIRIADERDAVQKKTFTKWVNKHLLKAGRRVIDLFEDLKDGHNLISLLEVLAKDTLPRERGKMRFHKIQNVQIALEYLRRKGIRLVNIRSDEIVDGNPKLTLGLIWTIILHFQISDVVVPGQPEDITAKDALLLWSRRTVEGYPGVKIKDFSSSWRDGKAFLAILHRNRPDIVDFRRVRTSTARQNLEMAFNIAEKEFGVTRLLDPEDVDVEHPDEKSVITYVSSLYDVFPEVPSVEQTLRDNERQIKIEEYRDMATSLLNWLRDATAIVSDRNFPVTLVEMKKLLVESNTFKIEDIPPRLDMKQKLLRLHDEIQGYGSHMAIPEELQPEHINRLWTRFNLAQQERDNHLHSEVIRLERLQRLAEKIHKEAKHCEESLDEIGRKIGEEQGRVEVLHPMEAKRNCDALERSIRSVEDTVRSTFRDVQALQDGRFPTADQLYRRVSALQSRVSQLRTQLFSEVIQKLLSKSYVEEGITVTRRKEVVTEIRMIDTNPAFKHVQECLNWIEAKQKSIEDGDYGGDVHTVQSNIDQHRMEHQQVLGFRKEIDKCISDQRTLSAEEQKLYTEWLSKVEVAFSLLTNTSSRRLKCLESLLDFIQLATQELIWLNQKEENEISRDWSSPEQDYQVTNELFQVGNIRERERVCVCVLCVCVCVCVWFIR